MKIPNPRPAGTQRILASDEITIEPGDAPGHSVLFKVSFRDRHTGAEAEVYLAPFGAINLAAALNRHVDEQTGIVGATAAMPIRQESYKPGGES